MTNKNESDDDLQPEVVEELISQRPTPGELLRSGREAMGLSVGQVADRLRLRQQQIQELEDDIFTAHVSGTYIRGYLRSYAKLLQLDDAEVIAAYEHLTGDQKPKGQMQSFSRKTSIETQDNRLMFFTWIVVLILIGSVAVFVWQQFTEDRDQAASSSIESSLEALSDAQEEAGVEANLPPADADLGNVDVGNQAEANSGQNETGEAGTAGEANIESETGLSSTAALESAPANPGPAASQVAATQANTDIARENPRNQQNLSEAERMAAAVSNTATDEEAGSLANVVQEAAEAVTDSGSANTTAMPNTERASVQNTDDPAELGELVLVFSGDSWIRIEDDSGEAIAYGVKAGGYVMPLDGAAPYELTLGAPSVVAVYFRGERVDLSEFSGGRIARFTLPRS